MSRIQDFMGKIVSFWGGIEFNGIFVGTAIRNWFVDAYIRFVVGVLEGLEQDYAKKLGPLLESVDLPPEAEASLKPILDELKNPTSQIAGILGGSAGGAAAGGLISSTIGPLLLLLQYKIQRGVEQWRLPLGTIVEAERRGILLSPAEQGDYMDQGVSSGRMDVLKQASKTLADAQSLIILRARQEIEPLEYIIRMKTLGYDEPEAETLYKALEFYPPPVDLINWVAKEVFEPDMVARYGLDAEFGGIDLAAFYKAHMTDEQITNYWRAHWEHASWGQVTDMLHRGLLTPGGIAPDIPTTRTAWQARDTAGEAALYDYYRLVEIPPFWRGLLTRISFAPLTRVDVRRMHKLGVLDRDALYSAYRTHGYDDTNAELMTEWTIKYNQGSTTAADRDLSKSDILRMYRERLLTRIDAHDMLIELGYNEDETTYLLDLYAQETATKTRDLTLSQVKNLYQRGIRNKTQVTAFLAAFGFDAAEVIALYELWDWEKPVDDDPKENSLTTTNLRDLYKRQILTRPQAQGYLLVMGYSSVDIGYIFDLWDYEKPIPDTVKSRDLSVSQLKQLYQQGLRSRAEVTPLLATIGYSSTEISALFELWDYVKPATVRVPTRSQIDKFLIAEIIDLDTWSAEYGAMGYELKYQEWYFALLMKGEQSEE